MSMEQRSDYMRRKQGTSSIPDYADLGFNDDKSEVEWSKYFDKLDFNLSEKESLECREVSVPDAARAEYFNCVIELSKRNGDQSHFAWVERPATPRHHAGSKSAARRQGKRADKRPCVEKFRRCFWAALNNDRSMKRIGPPCEIG